MTESSEGPKQIEVDRHSVIIIDGLKEAPIYKKQGEVHAIIANGGERIETRLADGTLETVNTAMPGDAIVTNPGGEKYIISSDKFKKRYRLKENEEDVYEAKGHCRAIDNPFGAPITMMASWGEMQSGAKDCKIADTYDPETDEFGGNPYIIGREEFASTYKEVES